MPRYTFTVRKRELELSLNTDDRNAIEQQLAIWVMAISRKPITETITPENYIPSPIVEPEESFNEYTPEPTEPTVSTSETDFVTEEDALPLSQEEKIFEEPEEKNIRTFEPERIEVQPEQNIEPTRQEYIEEFINTIKPDTELFSQPEPPIHNAESTVMEQHYEQIDKQAHRQASEQTIASLSEPEQIAPQHKQNELAVTLNSLFKAESPTTADFESILEKTVDNINSETPNIVKKDENFCKLVKANNITDRLELLLFTADYFCKYDARFSFSLKQINSKLMNNLAIIVDHGILKIALDNNYLEPYGEGEYRLTEYGRSEIYSKAGIWS